VLGEERNICLRQAIPTPVEALKRRLSANMGQAGPRNRYDLTPLPIEGTTERLDHHLFSAQVAFGMARGV
jgi:hypothetical protein